MGFTQAGTFTYSTLLADGHDVTSRTGTLATGSYKRGQVLNIDGDGVVAAVAGGKLANCVLADDVDATGGAAKALVYLTGRMKFDAIIWPADAAATGTLTSDNTNVADGATVTIGTKVYTFKTALTPAEGEVLIGADADGSLTNLKNAINHTGTPGTDYSVAAAHPLVTAGNVTAHAITITAKIAGPSGNTVAKAENSTHLDWDGTGGFLTGGTDHREALRDVGIYVESVIDAAGKYQPTPV